jgi:hypothetical protein
LFDRPLTSPSKVPKGRRLFFLALQQEVRAVEKMITDTKKGYGSIPLEEGELTQEELFARVEQTRSSRSLSDSLRESVKLIVDSSFVLSGDPSSVRDFGGTATIFAEVATISKNLIGAGVLSLSGGMAIYSNNPMAVLSASFWTILMGAIFGYYCFLVARICRITGCATYREMWAATVGETGAMAVPLANALKAGLGNLAYESILSQTLKSLLESIGVQWSRLTCLFVVTLFAILPLCLLKNLNVLAPFSILGTTGILFTCAAMGYRYFDGSYQPGGSYYDDVDPVLQPSFGNRNTELSTDVLPFVCMLFEVRRYLGLCVCKHLDCTDRARRHPRLDASLSPTWASHDCTFTRRPL